MYCSGEISGDLPRVMKLEGRVTQETYSLHCICLLPKIQLKYVTVGRENDENWNGISEIGTVSEMWSLKGRNSAVAFYNEPSIQSCKARQSWKVRGCLWGKRFSSSKPFEAHKMTVNGLKAPHFCLLATKFCNYKKGLDLWKPCLVKFP